MRLPADNSTLRAARAALATSAVLLGALPGAGHAGEAAAASPAASAAEQVEAVAVRALSVVQDVLHGRVSFYAHSFSGRLTASGERYDPMALTMAHPHLPFGTLVRVTNMVTQQSVLVRVNDRGPFVRGRVADLSHAAARQLRMLGSGVVAAKLEVLRLVGAEPPEPPPSAAARTPRPVRPPR